MTEEVIIEEVRESKERDKLSSYLLPSHPYTVSIISFISILIKSDLISLLEYFPLDISTKLMIFTAIIGLAMGLYFSMILAIDILCMKINPIAFLIAGGLHGLVLANIESLFPPMISIVLLTPTMAITMTYAFYSLSTAPRLEAGIEVEKVPFRFRPGLETRPFVFVDFVSALLFVPSIIEGEVFYLIGLNMNNLLLQLVGGFIVIYGFSGMLYFIISMFTPPTILRIAPLTTKWYVAFTIIRPSLYERARLLAKKLKIMVRRAGVFADPNILASRSIATSTILLVAIPPIAALGYFLNPIYGIMSIIFMGAGAVVAYYYPVLILSSKIGDRKRGVEKELPFFAVYAATMQSARILLPEALERLKSGLFKWIGKEAQIIKRNIEILGMDPVVALEQNARYHPSRKWREFIFGYTAILRTGGDLVAYLNHRVKEYLELSRFQLRQYAERSISLGEMLISVFTIFTSVVAVAALISPETVVPLMTIYNLLIIPALGSLMYGVITIMQPHQPNKYEFAHTISAVSIAVAGLIVFYFNFSYFYMISIPLLTLAYSYGLQFLKQSTEINDLEKSLPEFMRDLTEHKKIGLSAAKSIQLIAEREEAERYHKKLYEWIKKAAAHVRLGKKVSEVSAYLKSWLANMSIFLIGQIDESGGGTVETFETTTWFLSEYHTARSEMRAQLRLYIILALITPIFLLIMTSITETLLTGLTSLVSPKISGGASLPTFMLVSPDVLEGVKFQIWISTILSTLVLTSMTGKILDFTIKNTLPFALAMTGLIIGYYIIPPIIKSMLPTVSMSPYP